jgi:DNA-binding CsgD family transcriptional regulator
MGLSTRTIDAYRANIRKKLGLTQRRINLQTYLKSLG